MRAENANRNTALPTAFMLTDPKAQKRQW